MHDPHNEFYDEPIDLTDFDIGERDLSLILKAVLDHLGLDAWRHKNLPLVRLDEKE